MGTQAGWLLYRNIVIMIKPPIPKRDADILTWARRLNDYITSITVRTSATVKVKRMHGGTTLEAGGSGVENGRFYVEQATLSTVKVWDGIWTRNGIPIPLETDVGEDFKTITIPSVPSSMYYIRLTLSATGGTVYDHGLVPDELNADLTAVAPTNWEANSTQNRYQSLAIITTDTNGDIESITRTMETGDMDDISNIGDTNVDNPEWLSLEANPGSADQSYKALQMYEVANPSVAPNIIPADDLYPVRHLDTTRIIWATGTNMVNNGLGSLINDYLINNGDFWVQGDTGDNTCYGESIGNDSKTIVIDLDNSQLEDGSANTSLDWSSGECYDIGTGNVNLDYNTAYLQNTLGGNWRVLNGTTLDVLDTTIASVAGGALNVTGGGFFEKGVWAIKGTADQAVKAVNGTTYVILATATDAAFFSRGTENVEICNGTDAIAATGNIKINSTTGDYYHNSNQGASIGSALSGGINYGATHEIQFKNLQPDDYRLVRR